MKLFVPLALTLSATPVASDICTAGVDDVGFYSSNMPMQTFDVFESECPEVGTPKVFSLSWKMPAKEEDTALVAVQFSFGAWTEDENATKSANGLTGIITSRYADFIDKSEKPAENTLGAASYEAETGRSTCTGPLRSSGVLCGGASLNAPPLSAKDYQLLVWNNGDCEGKMFAQAIVREFSGVTTPPECTKAIEQIDFAPGGNDPATTKKTDSGIDADVAASQSIAAAVTFGVLAVLIL
jgi:hypothetical protein